MPDYHVYDSFIEHSAKPRKETYFKDFLNYSIGFATRGCFRHCDFCVNRNCNRVVFHSHVSEWFDPTRRYIYLWDDNILGYGRWRDVFAELEETKRYFQFRQGMDIRLMNVEKAEVLAACRYHGDFIFAFDNPEDAPIIERQLQLWRSYVKKQTKLYVLCGFVSQGVDEVVNVFERIKLLFRYRCIPYIMRHKDCYGSPMEHMFTAIARWSNQPNMCKKLSFRQWCYVDQKGKKNPVVAVRTMLEFERTWPDIAAKYFDMRMEDIAEI